MIDDISLKNIPTDSKLLILGDWFRRPGEGWKVVCYFHNKEKGHFRKSFPIDLLPLLISGLTFPTNSKANKTQGWTGTAMLPEQELWEKASFTDLPDELKRSQNYSEQFENNKVYRITKGEKTYWLPLYELARALFFHSAECVRAAAYQGNTWQLARSWSGNRIGEIELSSNIPVGYLSNPQYRNFFTWLLFDESIENSFNSIFPAINTNTLLNDGSYRWSFDFTPPDLSNCEISYSGFYSKVDNHQHIFIREIRSIAGLKAPDLDKVYFSHPDDKIYLENEELSPSENKPPKKKRPTEKPKQLDPDNKPKAEKRRHLINMSGSGLSFDSVFETQRRPPEVQNLPPKNDSEELKEPEQSENGSFQQGDDKGKHSRADANNLPPPNPVQPSEKLALFMKMLDMLKEEHNWAITSKIGEVPKVRCRSLHLIDQRARQYCHAIIERDKSTNIHVLEIELSCRTNKEGNSEHESLSTLIFRPKNTNTALQTILIELMSNHKNEGLKAMSWKKKRITKSTSVCEYLGHPDNKILTDEDSLKSWMERAVSKVLRM
ncbi:Tn7-like element transposition protein TnsE [Agaribacterium sp. ZY112]|uniref:Tn7-like element transposition protein TnsE n=1 Tax=Agaribacterium sp. ZY112 TaxID=3233574 RepID=UPI003526B36A